MTDEPRSLEVEVVRGGKGSAEFLIEPMILASKAFSRAIVTANPAKREVG